MKTTFKFIDENVIYKLNSIEKVNQDYNLFSQIFHNDFIKKLVCEIYFLQIVNKMVRE